MKTVIFNGDPIYDSWCRCEYAVIQGFFRPSVRIGQEQVWRQIRLLAVESEAGVSWRAGAGGQGAGLDPCWSARPIGGS